MKKTFAFIESNTTGSGERFIRCAFEMGLDVLFLSSNPKKYPFLKNSGSTQVLEVDSQNRRAILNALKSYDHLAGVFSTSEYFIEMAAKIGKALKKPANNPKAIALCRQKDRFYQAAISASCQVPQTWVIKVKRDLETYRAEFHYPVVIKPSCGSGSVGVKKCLTYDELCRAYQKLQDKRVIIQSYIAGPEYSAEIVVTGKKKIRLGISKKYTTAGSSFVELGHDFPATLHPNLEEKSWQVIETLLEKLEFSFGPAHIEFKIQDSEVVIIEVNPRLAGGMIPELIALSTQIDIYCLLIQMFIDGSFKLERLNCQQGAAIRFFTPPSSGILKCIPDVKQLSQLANVTEVSMLKKVGDSVEVAHDFRDRIGFLITHGENSEAAKNFAIKAFENVRIEVDSGKGRLSAPPHQEILRILRGRVDEKKTREELLAIATIDQAYLLMLAKQKILKHNQVSPLLEAILRFQENIDVFYKELDYSRGTYYAYENYLKAQIGGRLAGNNHIGRSRNDVQATLLQMRLRDSLLLIYQGILQFINCLIEKARSSLTVFLPIYSQYQPAAPGTYAYYLMAIYENLLRILRDLSHVSKELWTCPLGSGAGVGTEFPIDQLHIAKLLGFHTCFPHALDAIANKDSIVRFGSILVNLSLLLSRVAEDFQLWTTLEFRFFDLPDSLCGSSSMMPQKKNPYILEVIKNKAMDISVEIHGIACKMHKVPIGNSVEVSTAAFSKLESITKNGSDLLDLLTLVITHATPLQESMLRSHQRGGTIANYLTHKLMKVRSISFREAHQIVGVLIREARISNEDIFDYLVQNLNLAEPRGLEEILEDLSEKMCFGGGVGKTRAFLDKAEGEVLSLSNWVDQCKRRLMEAEQSLQAQVSRFISS